LGRFGISVNDLLARETTAVPIYISAPGDGHIFGLGGIFAGGFPDFSQGLLFWTLPGRARTLPEHKVCFSIVCNHAYDVPPRHSRLPVSTRPVAEPPYGHVV
jgi:hypothetical protein